MAIATGTALAIGGGVLLGGALAGGGGSSTSVRLTPQQQELTAQQVRLGEFQLAELARQRRLQEQAFGAVEPSLEAFEQFVSSQTADTAKLDAAEDELLQDMLDRIRAGGAATPLEIELINSATQQAIDAGESDISAFLKTSLAQLRDELAPQLGLRPGDTPILDRGGLAAAESARQQGQLVRDLRGQQFATRLGFPLQRAGVLGGLNLGQQEAGAARKEFLARLTESAFINRLRLAQGRTGAGLGLVGAGTPNIAPLFENVSSKTSNQLGFSDIVGGAGGLLTGIGLVSGGTATTAGLAAASSRALKDSQGPVDDEAILAALVALPVERWTYKGDNQEHVGPMAEDFTEAFDLGDGRSIAYIDAIGVLMSAVRGLAKELASIKALANKPVAALPEPGV